MHPSLNHDIARCRQADMHREAARARRAHEVSVAAERRSVAQPVAPLNLTWLRRHPANRDLVRPILGH